MGSDLEQASDEELIIAAQSATPERKAELIGELARRHHEGLLSFIISIVSDRAAAEDLVQETFMRVFRSAESYKEIARFSTWLYKIGRNLSLNELRDRRRRPDLVLNRPVGAGEGEGEVVQLIAADEAPPIEPVDQADTRALLRRLINALPDGYRETLVLVDLEGLSYQDCAEVLDIKVGTVRSRLSRARAMLLEQVKPILGERGEAI